jgi:hypothetical protein
LSLNEIGPQTLGLTVDAVRVPKNAQLVYSWDFGDGKQESLREPATRHTFAKPGQYTISVQVFEETPTLSVELGEARAVVTLGTAPPPGRTTGPRPVELTFSTSLVIDGDSSGDDPTRVVIRKAGQFHMSSSVLRLTYVPGSTRIESDFELELSLKVSDEFFFPAWKLHASGQAAGPFDPQVGTLRLATDNVKWSENVPLEFPILGIGGQAARGHLSPEQHAFAVNEAHRMMGAVPSQLPWSGQIHGTIDWKNFGGGQGRLELNKIFRGTWKVDPGAPYYVRLPDDITAPDGKRHPLLRLYPNPSAARRAYNGWSRSGPLLMGGKKDLTDFGDEAVWSPPGGILVRIGRWHLDLSRPAPYRSSNPEQFRPLLDKVQVFISDSGLETSLPELPEQ